MYVISFKITLEIQFLMFCHALGGAAEFEL